MVTRDLAIQRAKAIIVEREALILRYGEEVRALNKQIEDLQQRRERKIIDAGDHVANITGRYEEIVELFGLTQEDIDAQAIEPRTSEGVAAGGSCAGGGCSCQGRCKGHTAPEAGRSDWAEAEEAHQSAQGWAEAIQNETLREGYPTTEAA